MLFDFELKDQACPVCDLRRTAEVAEPARQCVLCRQNLVLDGRGAALRLAGCYHFRHPDCVHLPRSREEAYAVVANLDSSAPFIMPSPTPAPTTNDDSSSDSEDEVVLMSASMAANLAQSTKRNGARGANSWLCAGILLVVTLQIVTMILLQTA